MMAEILRYFCKLLGNNIKDKKSLKKVAVTVQIPKIWGKTANHPEGIYFWI